MEIGRAKIERPFRGNGDSTSLLIKRRYKVRPEDFVPMPLKTPDSFYSTAYLIEESDPEPTATGLLEFSRTFAHVPAQQIIPSSMFITKPEIPGVFPQVYGETLITQPDESIPRYTFYTQTAVTSDSGAPAASYPSGGTYTVTIGADTTAPIAYNADAATLKTALDALASVSSRSSVTVTGSHDSARFAITLDSYPTFSTDILNLTFSGGYIANNFVRLNTNGTSQDLTVTASEGQTITGGTFTITAFGQTTAPIAYNASYEDVEAALNALSSVAGSASLTRLSGYARPLSSDARNIWMRVEIAKPDASADGSSLAPAGWVAEMDAAEYTDGWALEFSIPSITTRSVTAAAHGITTADTVLVTMGGGYYNALPGSFSVPTAHSISFTASAGEIYTSASTITAVGKQNGSAYTAGTKLARCNRVTDFYLPGVTEGIATAEDIPLPTYQGDASSLLEAILTGAEEMNYEVGELTQWRSGPILARTVTKINAASL